MILVRNILHLYLFRKFTDLILVFSIFYPSGFLDSSLEEKAKISQMSCFQIFFTKRKIFWMLFAHATNEESN